MLEKLGPGNRASRVARGAIPISLEPIVLIQAKAQRLVMPRSTPDGPGTRKKIKNETNRRSAPWTNMNTENPGLSKKITNDLRRQTANPPPSWLLMGGTTEGRGPR
jgi:hypothetical protein